MYLADASPSEQLLSMRGICKSFPGVCALNNVDLDLSSGEVLALIGENGAGKSTLIKMLGGAHQPDSGSISIDGKPVVLSSPLHAQQLGMAVIYQEFNLVPALTATENIFLGQERSSFGLVRSGHERNKARRLFERIGVRVDPDAPCRELSIAQQQVVEIAKALALDARILVMDEPTATLTPREVAGLFDVVRQLRAQGLGIVYISHRLEEIFDMADRVMVLRDGRVVGTHAIAGIDRSGLIEMMVGRKLEAEFPPRSSRIGPPRFRVEGLTRRGAVDEVSFVANRGEVLAITGLVGAGRTELARLIFGADPLDAGSIELDGKTLNVRHPIDAIKSGICLLTENRKDHGLVLGHSIRDNYSLPNLAQFSRWGVINNGKESKAFQNKVADLQIKITGPYQLARNLSGGNQQKLVLAKWLARNCEVIIFDEPTRGIDVGAKYEIYQLINALAESGKVIIMISSELPEVLGMSDRILVMHDGRVIGELSSSQTTQEQIMELAVG